MMTTTSIYIFISVVGFILALMLYNLVAGKAMLIKYLAVNIITSCMVVAIVLFATMDETRRCYLDAAIVYVLISFVFNIAIMRYLKETR